ncbi:MAG: metal-dependent hydrolase [Methanotrichaceae archaeon]|nr:metal-dependent hydrolase [Methanotrichaceae archaeon]
MDFFSHALLPFLLGSYLGLDKRLLAALVLGGIAPDLDVFFSWINNVYPTSLLLVHRGITHTLFFGFFFALMLLYLCTHEPVKGYLGRIIKFDLDFSASSMAFVYAGVLIHLALDFTTTIGVPLFYPWQSLRYSADIFFQIEPIILIGTFLVLAVLMRDKSHAKFNKNLFILFMVFLLVVGGIRMEGKQSAQSYFNGTGAEVFPESGLFQWAVLEDEGERYLVSQYDYLEGNISSRTAFPRLFVASSVEEAEKEIAAAEELPQVRLFRWRAYAVAINATSENGSSWEIEYYDPLVKAQMDGSRRLFRPPSRSYGSVKVRVENGVARVED